MEKLKKQIESILKTTSNAVDRRVEAGLREVQDILDAVGEDAPSATCDVKLEFNVPLQADIDRTMKANLEGHEYEDPRDEHVEDIQIVFYPAYHNTLAEGIEDTPNRVIAAGDQPGREPGFGHGTLADIGGCLLTAHAALKTSFVPLPRVAISFCRDDGQRFTYDGEIEEAFDVINESIHNESFSERFKAIVPDDEPIDLKSVGDVPLNENQSSPMPAPEEESHLEELPEIIKQAARQVEAEHGVKIKVINVDDLLRSGKGASDPAEDPSEV